jgi:hypothetical protein
MPPLEEQVDSGAESEGACACCFFVRACIACRLMCVRCADIDGYHAAALVHVEEVGADGALAIRSWVCMSSALSRRERR